MVMVYLLSIPVSVTEHNARTDIGHTAVCPLSVLVQQYKVYLSRALAYAVGIDRALCDTLVCEAKFVLNKFRLAN